MSLIDQIDNDIKLAMKARDKDKLDALRAVKAAILLAKTEKGSSGEINAEQELKILQKLIKQRKESAEIFKSQNREDLAEIEQIQLEFIEVYLPQMMSEDEITQILKSILEQNQIVDPKDFGKAMGLASKQLSGKADNKLISDVLRKLLN